MKIGLIDVDGHNFPNLCLMKISAYHKQRGDSVSWWSGFEHYDIVYKSRVFTDEYTADHSTAINAEQVIQGGTGYDLKNKLPDDVEHIMPDYCIYPHFDEAYGFLTRGCPRACEFCIVAEKEGKCSYKVANLSEFWKGQRTIKLLDPNLLACRDQEDLLMQLANSKAWVDFTQGLDARCVTEDNAKLLSKIKTKMVHFAFDDVVQEDSVLRGLEIYKRITGIKEHDTGVYILTNFNTTHEQDIYRVKKVQELGYRPYIMVYNKRTAPQVTRDLQRWSNNRIIYAASDRKFENYNKPIGKYAMWQWKHDGWNIGD